MHFSTPTKKARKIRAALRKIYATQTGAIFRKWVTEKRQEGTFVVNLHKLNSIPIFRFRLVEDLDLCILEFKDFGKDYIKSKMVSPDGFVQLTMQLAYYR